MVRNSEISLPMKFGFQAEAFLCVINYLFEKHFSASGAATYV